jgi:hypothetical protein
VAVAVAVVVTMVMMVVIKTRIGPIGTEKGFGMRIVVRMIRIAMGVVVTMSFIMGGGGCTGGRVLVHLVSAAVTTRQGEYADHQDSCFHRKSHGLPPTYCSSI